MASDAALIERACRVLSAPLSARPGRIATIFQARMERLGKQDDSQARAGGNKGSTARTSGLYYLLPFDYGRDRATPECGLGRKAASGHADTWKQSMTPE
jgi:hypothetical protein